MTSHVLYMPLGREERAGVSVAVEFDDVLQESYSSTRTKIGGSLLAVMKKQKFKQHLEMFLSPETSAIATTWN